MLVPRSAATLDEVAPAPRKNHTFPSQDYGSDDRFSFALIQLLDDHAESAWPKKEPLLRDLARTWDLDPDALLEDVASFLRMCARQDLALVEPPESAAD